MATTTQQDLCQDRWLHVKLEEQEAMLLEDVL